MYTTHNMLVHTYCTPGHIHIGNYIVTHYTTPSDFSLYSLHLTHYLMHYTLLSVYYTQKHPANHPIYTLHGSPHPSNYLSYNPHHTVRTTHVTITLMRYIFHSKRYSNPAHHCPITMLIWDMLGFVSCLQYLCTQSGRNTTTCHMIKHLHTRATSPNTCRIPTWTLSRVKQIYEMLM